MLDIDELKEALPKTLQGAATQSLLAKVNNAATDLEFAKQIRENFVSYASVLEEGRFRIEDYLNAVVYCSYRIMDYNNQESWAKTFPKKYAELKASGANKKVISAYVASYNKGKLVNLIMEQSLIPFYVFNQEARQKALEHQVFLMTNAASEKVQTEAANSVLTHLKPPETKKIELDIGMKEDAGMTDMREMMSSMAKTQRELIQAGVPTHKIAHQKLGDVIDVTAEEMETFSKPTAPVKAAPKTKMSFKTVEVKDDE